MAKDKKTTNDAIRRSKDSYEFHKSRYDKAMASGNKEAAKDARKGMDAAHSQAEGARKAGGRGSGGTDGSLDKDYTVADYKREKETAKSATKFKPASALRGNPMGVMSTSKSKAPTTADELLKGFKESRKAMRKKLNLF